MGALISGASVAKPPSGTSDAVFPITFFNSSIQPVAVSFSIIEAEWPEVKARLEAKLAAKARGNAGEG